MHSLHQWRLSVLLVNCITDLLRLVWIHVSCSICNQSFRIILQSKYEVLVIYFTRKYKLKYSIHSFVCYYCLHLEWYHKVILPAYHCHVYQLFNSAILKIFFNLKILVREKYQLTNCRQDRQTDERAGGWADGRTDGRTDRQKDIQTVCYFFY